MTTFQGFTRTDGTEVTPEKQAKMAEQIGKLIAMSEDDSLTREARAAYGEKAEALMRDYRVNEEFVISSGDSQIIPVRYEIVLVEGFGRYYSNEFQDAYLQIWGEIKRHASIQGHCEYRYDESENARQIVAVGYGYEIDIRLAQFLWTAAHLTFATRIDAKVNPALSDQLNCYFMRGSGMERIDIAAALWGEETRLKAGPHAKVQKLYLAECEARGETPMVGGRGFIATRYRKAYAEGFTDQFGWRLRDARSAVDAKSGGLVLHGREERVQEAYWAEWPEKAPETPEARAAREAKSAEYWEAQEAAEKECQAKGKCSAALKRAQAKAAERGYPLRPSEIEAARCKQHRPYEVTQTQRARWEREANAPERSAGRRAGVAAASSIDFRRTGGERAQKADAAPVRPQIG